MNSLGTLRSTLRSRKHDEIIQVVSQISHAHTKWVIEQVRNHVVSCIRHDQAKSNAKLKGLGKGAVSGLSRILCEVVLVLHSGTTAKDGRVAEPGAAGSALESESAAGAK